MLAPPVKPVTGETAVANALENAAPAAEITFAVLEFRDTRTARIATPTMATAIVVICSPMFTSQGLAGNNRLQRGFKRLRECAAKRRDNVRRVGIARHDNREH